MNRSKKVETDAEPVTLRGQTTKVYFLELYKGKRKKNESNYGKGRLIVSSNPMST